jgi:hypothetical protein
MDGFWIVISSAHLSIGIDSANVDNVAAVRPKPTADQFFEYVILGGRCGPVAFGLYGLGGFGAIGIGISEMIYENTCDNGQSRQTEYHLFSRKASFLDAGAILRPDGCFFLLRVLITILIDIGN